jgi:hypothetical protein
LALVGIEGIAIVARGATTGCHSGLYGTIGVFSLIAGAMAIVFVVIGGFGPPVTRRRLEAIAA